MRTSLTLLLALFVTIPLTAEEKPVGVYDVTEKVEGKTYGEWAAEWWKWAIRIPKEKNPVLDKTGAFAGEGQTQAVWFLAGTFGNKAERTFTIPSNKPLLISAFNYVAGKEVKKRSDKETQDLIKELTAEAKTMVDRAEGLGLTVDGTEVKDLKKFRVVSAVFETVGPDADKALHLSFAGKQTSVADGYWVLLKPLAPGPHTIQVKSKLTPKKGEPAFNLDVTYKITVAAKK
jgi:hypothetical protein